MLNVQSFTFNPFQENSYVVYDEASKSAVIFDPGASNLSERSILEKAISALDLDLHKLINTHCHIDHVLGNQFISKKYNLILEAHKKEEVVLESCDRVSKMYNIPYDTSPKIRNFIEDRETITIGDYTMSSILAPGHSPGSLCFYCEEFNFLIGGDVLFFQSIGRTDLPGGDHNTLITSIKERLFPLPDSTVVYSGHGPNTTIGLEKGHNPFLT